MSTEDEILEFAEKQWGPRTLEKLANKLAEECGEVAGAVVKLEEDRATELDLINEIGDALIVLSQFAAKYHLSLEDIRAMRLSEIYSRAEFEANPPTIIPLKRPLKGQALGKGLSEIIEQRAEQERNSPSFIQSSARRAAGKDFQD